MAVRIRNFQPADFEQIMKIERDSFVTRNPELYVRLYEMNPNGFIVADDDGVIAGYIMIVLAEDMSGRLFSIAVKNGYRQRGIAARLVESSYNLLRANNIEVLKLEVRESNKAAINLYKKLGFRTTGIGLGYYENGENAVRMVKNIAKS